MNPEGSVSRGGNRPWQDWRWDGNTRWSVTQSRTVPCFIVRVALRPAISGSPVIRSCSVRRTQYQIKGYMPRCCNIGTFYATSPTAVEQGTCGIITASALHPPPKCESFRNHHANNWLRHRAIFQKCLSVSGH